MDNLTLDEEGVVGLRMGAATLNSNLSSGEPDPIRSASSEIRSAFTTMLGGSRYRVLGVKDGNAQYGYHAQPSGVWRPFATFETDRDVVWGAFQGMILGAVGTTKYKHTGSKTWRWGVPAPTAKPHIIILPPRVITVSTFDASELSAWVAKEGTTASVAGQNNAAGGAIGVTPAAATRRGTIEKAYATVQNFDSFDSGAATGVAEDTIEFYVWGAPDGLEYVSVAFDCNPSSSNPFQDDYYIYEMSPGDAVEVKLDDRRALADHPEVEGRQRDRVEEERRGGRGGEPRSSRIRGDMPGTTSGWSKFTVLRGQFDRVGSTNGCNWSTIKNVQMSFKYRDNAPSIPSMRFDGLRILGGSDRTLTGKFRAHVVYTRDFGDYIAKSAPSPISDEFECKNNAVQVALNSAVVTAADEQVQQGGEGWAYLAGGTMRNFYRFATKSVSAGKSLNIDCTISETEAIIANLKMESDNYEPPDDIVAMVCNHYNKVVVCTEKKVHISRDGNPDSFFVSLDLADEGETIRWAVKGDSGVKIGTSKDVYRLSGSLSLLPDETIDARLDPMGVPGAINEFVVQDGDEIVYLAADGYRLLSSGVQLINFNLDLLIQGQTRHSILPPDLGISATFKRFRGALFNRRLYVMHMEGEGFDSSQILYVLDFRRRQWRRERYTYAFLSLYREPDGTVIGGDGAGRLWQLAAVTGIGDRRGTIEVEIPVVYRGISDADGRPFAQKEAYDWRGMLDTGGATATVNLVLDETTTVSLSVAQSGYGLVQQTLGANTGMVPYTRVQHHITGNFKTLKIGHLGIVYRERPMGLLYWDSSLLDFGADHVEFRELAFKLRAPQNVVVRVKFGDWTAFNKEVQVEAGVDNVYPVEVGRGVRGRLPLIILEPIVSGDEGPQPDNTSPTRAFKLYWVRAKFRKTGNSQWTEKWFQIVGGKGGM